ASRFPIRAATLSLAYVVGPRDTFRHRHSSLQQASRVRRPGGRVGAPVPVARASRMSGAGFSGDLRTRALADPGIQLVDLDRVYAGG
ncbi:MAG: hypothetical protein JXA67_21790, partial [Micromonosporaceae bacterium]|nr:hypothetical protein [Micromonosporaceae bacterium]